MKIEDCPLGDKTKLRFVLKGKEKVCAGHFEKNDDGAVMLCENCRGCKFRDPDVAIVGYNWPNPATCTHSLSGTWSTWAANTCTYAVSTDGTSLGSGSYGNTSGSYNNNTGGYLPSSTTTTTLFPELEINEGNK